MGSNPIPCFTAIKFDADGPAFLRAFPKAAALPPQSLPTEAFGINRHRLELITLP